MRPYPRAWNDRVIWLLERLLGIPSGFSETDELPVGAPDSPVYTRVRLSITGASSSTELAVQLPTATRTWEVAGLSLVRSSGSASTWAPRLGENAGFAAGSIDERVAYDAASTATPINDVFCAPVPVRTDPSGRLYFRPGFDAGTNNAATAELWFRQAIEAA